jgi:hypothetical protein
MLRFLWRVVGALALRPAAYEEVEADRRSLPQALSVVMLSGLAAGVPDLEHTGVRGLLAGLTAVLVGWLCWSWLVFHIGARWLPGKNTQADWGQLLRTTGFAAAPGILRIAGVMPEARIPMLWLTSVWMLLAFVIAVRQALDYEETWRAVVVCLAGWVAYVTLLLVLPSACGLDG